MMNAPTFHSSLFLRLRSISLMAGLLAVPAASEAADPIIKTSPTTATTPTTGTSPTTGTTSTTAPTMPPTCDANAFYRTPIATRPTKCDYLYRAPILRDCDQFAVFYTLIADTDEFHAYGVCSDRSVVYFHLYGRMRAPEGGVSSYMMANLAISQGVIDQTTANSGFSFGSDVGAGYFPPKGTGPGPSGPGGDESAKVLLAAAGAYFNGQAAVQKLLSEL